MRGYWLAMALRRSSGIPRHAERELGRLASSAPSVRCVALIACCGCAAQEPPVSRAPPPAPVVAAAEPAQVPASSGSASGPSGSSSAATAPSSAAIADASSAAPDSTPPAQEPLAAAVARQWTADAPRLRRCAQRAKPSGPLAVEWTIEPAGQVSGVHVTNAPPSLAECVKNVLSSWTFPPQPAAVRVRHPISEGGAADGGATDGGASVALPAVPLPAEPWYRDKADRVDECVAPPATPPRPHFPPPFDACDPRAESYTSPPGSGGLHFHYRNFSARLTTERRARDPGVCCYMIWEFPRRPRE